MYRSRLSFLAIILALVVPGCSDTASTPTIPSSNPGGANAITASQIAGTWKLVSLQRSGQSVQTAPADAEYALTLTGDRASARADCNSCGGAFAVSGQTVTVGPNMACTRAACPTMAFESSYTAILAGQSTALVEGNTLTLDSSRGRLLFRR
jgi:heat shock protein HslJ